MKRRIRLFACKYAVFQGTALRKVLAALTAIVGIRLIAMPIEILSVAFSDAMQARRRATGVERAAISSPRKL